jgi:hypothetical protein
MFSIIYAKQQLSSSRSSTRKIFPTRQHTDGNAQLYFVPDCSFQIRERLHPDFQSEKKTSALAEYFLRYNSEQHADARRRTRDAGPPRRRRGAAASDKATVACRRSARGARPGCPCAERGDSRGHPGHQHSTYSATATSLALPASHIPAPLPPHPS